MSDDVFTWKGQELTTMGDLADAVLAVESPEEAREFMAAYMAQNVHAYSNIGYLAGYFDRSTTDRVYEWFETAHPVWGRHHPTPEEALEIGKRMGEAQLRRDEARDS